MALTAVAIDLKIAARQITPTIGKEVLVHDGKRVIARHGPECHTGCGNPAFVMVTGTREEIDAEIARLKLTSDDVKPAALPIDVNEVIR